MHNVLRVFTINPTEILVIFVRVAHAQIIEYIYLQEIENVVNDVIPNIPYMLLHDTSKIYLELARKQLNITYTLYKAGKTP